MGSEPLKRNNFETVTGTLNGECKFIVLFWAVGESKKNAQITKNPPVFHLNFLKGVEHTPGHVTTPNLSANKKLQGFEHAHLSKEAKRQI
jgi:hypothetical protein